MTESILEVEARRARWERYRSRLGMTWDAGDGFALGGLGAHVTELDARVLVLPADPDANVISLDGERERWLMEEGGASYGGPAFLRGHEVGAFADALIRCDRAYGAVTWRRHAALYIHGGIDVACGRLAYSHREMRVFPLRSLVALVWVSLALFKEGASQRAGQPVAELTIGLRNAAGATLGSFSEGWAELGNGLHDPPTCLHSPVLLRHELVEEFEPAAVAMQIGDRLENAFGSTSRRHIASRGDYAGQFDPRFAI